MRRLAIMASALLVVVLSKLVLEDLLGLDLGALVAGPTDAGLLGGLLVVALLAADIGVPVPSSVVMVVSGVLFGGAVGGALSFTGAMASAWSGYELSRRFGRPLAARLAGADTLDDLETLFARHGIALVVATRALPIAMEAASLVAGLSRMRRAPYLVACAAGTAPVAWLYAYAGARSRATGQWLPAAIILLGFAVAWGLTRQRWSSTAGRKA